MLPHGDFLVVAVLSVGLLPDAIHVAQELSLAVLQQLELLGHRSHSVIDAAHPSLSAFHRASQEALGVLVLLSRDLDERLEQGVFWRLRLGLLDSAPATPLSRAVS